MSVKRPTTSFQIKTPHYSFHITFTKSEDKLVEYYFLVGEKNNPCLDGNITLENISGNTRYDDVKQTAHLHNIKALANCSLEDISDEQLQKYSFGYEMLHALSYFIKSQFPQINTIKFTDNSEIICDVRTDLLIYSLALYEKTWYERRMNAYFTPLEKFMKYRKQVEEYASIKTKQDITLGKILIIMNRSNNFAKTTINDNKQKYQELWNKSRTLPEFFKKVNQTIPREDKCLFFKGWLEDIIKPYISIERSWQFDLQPKIASIQELNMLPLLNQTRKQNRLNLESKGNQKLKTEYLQFQTPHYQFQMTLQKSMKNQHRQYFYVGDKKNPCLQASVVLEKTNGNTNNKKSKEQSAHLQIFQPRIECVVGNITNDKYSKYNFCSELIEAFTFFMNSQFEPIKCVKITDTMVLHCDNSQKSSLDMLTYFIALNKKTWYEEQVNAYLIPKEKQDAYRAKVDEYALKETKTVLSFQELSEFISKQNPQASHEIKEKETQETTWNESSTLPDFFNKICQIIPQNDICKFFDTWLRQFISAKIPISREWYQDIYPQITPIQDVNLKKALNQTRRRTHKNQNP